MAMSLPAYATGYELTAVEFVVNRVGTPAHGNDVFGRHFRAPAGARLSHDQLDSPQDLLRPPKIPWRLNLARTALRSVPWMTRYVNWNQKAWRARKRNAQPAKRDWRPANMEMSSRFRRISSLVSPPGMVKTECS